MSENFEALGGVADLHNVCLRQRTSFPAQMIDWTSSRSSSTSIKDIERNMDGAHRGSVRE